MLKELIRLHFFSLGSQSVISILVEEKVDIALLQETHLDDEAHLKLKHNWPNLECLMSVSGPVQSSRVMLSHSGYWSCNNADISYTPPVEVGVRASPELP